MRSYFLPVLLSFLVPKCNESCSVAKLCPTLFDPMYCTCQVSLFFTIPWSLLKLMCWVSDAIQPSHPLLPPSPFAFNLSSIGAFPMNQLFSSGGQNNGASASVPIHSINCQSWFPLGLTILISLQSKGLSAESEASILQHSDFFMDQLSHLYMTMEKS